MNIQERVLTTLKPLVASKGFGEKTMQGLATNLSANLTEESTDEDITTAINGAMPLFDIMQSENTRYVNEWKKKNPTPTNLNPNPAPNPNPAAPEPTGSEKVIAELAKKVDLLLQQNSQLSLKQKWDKLAEANGITNAFLINKCQPQTEEDFDNAIEELKNFNKDFVKQTANEKSPGKPNSGGATLPEASKSLTATGKQVLASLQAQNEQIKNK